MIVKFDFMYTTHNKVHSNHLHNVGIVAYSAGSTSGTRAQNHVCCLYLPFLCSTDMTLVMIPSFSVNELLALDL